jgi:branched-chain amino acid transport system ATP-binding protein
MLEVSDIHTYYGGSYVLKGISLAVKESSVVAIMGRNGAGKTTIISSIIGLTPPRRGVIRFKGKDITALKPYQIGQMGMGYIPQGRQIFPSLSVKENLTIAARGEVKQDEWTLDKIYSTFPILKKRANYGGTNLSGGEQQILAISRALMTNPDLLLMDEPSDGLAPVVVKEVRHIISQLKEGGYSILLVEQNLPMALSLADYIYVISKGIIVYESRPEELSKNEEIKTKYLGVSK